MLGRSHKISYVNSRRGWSRGTLPCAGYPPLLHLPDGRVVPTCVVTARPDPAPERPLERVAFASDLLGGGYPVMNEAQGIEQVGTLGCLVTDGRLVHALTARHVCGRSGEPLYTLVRGSRELIGVSHDVQAGKLADRDSITLTNLDAGLVRIDDLTRWSAQVFGIGELGEPIDLHDGNLTLDLIGCPLRAFGGVSGVLEGEIHGLLYRNHHVGGAALQTDLLIGPRADRGPLETRPGDSGTLWCFDPASRRVTDDDSDNVHPWLDAPPAQRGAHARRLRPVAMQWGGARLSDSDGHPARFALGTFLSTICRRLDVEVVTGWNVGHGEYWGKTAHFKMGAKACELVTTPALRQLLELNRTRIGFGDDVLSLGTEFRVGRGKYVPLADVPDYVWIAQAYGGAEARAAEASQHFADLDEPGFAPFAGKTLLELCARDAKNLDPAVWARFYASFPPDAAPERGVLPFRIWQIYDSMVDAVRRKDMLWFVAAAGVLAHYVGDACQPLHVSRLHHGRAPRRGTPEYDAYKKTPQYKIHSVFEQVMFAVCATEMLAAINARLAAPVKVEKIRGGRQAAAAAFELMKTALESLSPEVIMGADDPKRNQPDRGRLMFERIGGKTAALVADGCRCLVRLWESAWQEGGAPAAGAVELKLMSERELQGLYRSSRFLPAFGVEGVGERLGE